MLGDLGGLSGSRRGHGVAWHGLQRQDLSARSLENLPSVQALVGNLDNLQKKTGGNLENGINLSYEGISTFFKSIVIYSWDVIFL